MNIWLQNEQQQSGAGRRQHQPPRPVVAEEESSSSSSAAAAADDDDDENEEGEEEEEEEEEETPPSSAILDSFIEVEGTWERGRSRSRRTVQEALEVRFRDWRSARWPHRMLEWIVGRLIQRALGHRPAPMLLGFALQPAGWTSAYHIPLR